MQKPSDKTLRILIVDDEPPVRDLLAEILGERYLCETADSAESAIERIADGNYSVVISDIDMPGVSGIEMVPMILSVSPDTVILMISGSLSMDYAVRAIRVGAFDYIPKPFELDFVELSVERAINHHRQLIGKKQYETDLEQLVMQRTEELNFLIYHDSLTNLPNRVLFEDRLGKAVMKARADGNLAVAFLSIDGFEKLQDHFGHAEADKILLEVSSRLTSAVEASSTVSRLQGVDFAILLTESVDSVGDLAGRLRDEIKRPIICHGTELFLGASVGISLYPADGLSPEELMKNAGNALFRARARGGDRVQFYADGKNADTANRIVLESEMRRGLDRDEFEVFYQPKVNVASGEITGMEALVRWNHPERGMISPSEFIPLAEETGLIVPLGELVFKTACTQSKAWHDQGFKLEIAVNVSAKQLKLADLADRFQAIIESSGIDPSLLNLEVTESSLLEDEDASIERLERLRWSGVHISLDDFGTGYSSLAYLKKLPIDQLKIDREFIKDIAEGNDEAVFAMTMVNLAHSLRLKVVAEGVEEAEQLKFLNLIGCDEYQGFLFSKPVPAAEFERLLHAQTDKVQISLSDNGRLSILPHQRRPACSVCGVTQ